jgi:hypothetical protein
MMTQTHFTLHREEHVRTLDPPAQSNARLDPLTIDVLNRRGRRP